MRAITHLSAFAGLVLLGQALVLSLAAQPPADKKDDPRDEPKAEEIKPIEFKGALTDADPRDAVKTDCAHKVHVVKLQANRTYQIDLIKKQDVRTQDGGYYSRYLRWDPYLRIEDSKKNRLADDDDSGGDLNARIVFTPPKDDDYRLIVTAMYGTGEYTLKVSGVTKYAVIKFEDRLGAGDKIDDGKPGCFCKVFQVNLIKGRTYTLDMVSNNLDSYLRIEDARKNRLAEDDDSGGNLNARIVFQPTETGSYRLIATTFSPGEVGTFTLTVRDDTQK